MTMNYDHATSLEVAEKFDKRHADVLRAIDELECSEEFRRLNFQESSYEDEQGKEQPMFRMTGDSFFFLAMTFTGGEAARLKEQLIASFFARASKAGVDPLVAFPDLFLTQSGEH